MHDIWSYIAVMSAVTIAIRLTPALLARGQDVPRHYGDDAHPRGGGGGVRVLTLSRVERGKSLSRGGGGVGDGVSRGAAFLCIMFGIRICHFLGSVI